MEPIANLAYAHIFARAIFYPGRTQPDITEIRIMPDENPTTNIGKEFWVKIASVPGYSYDDAWNVAATLLNLPAYRCWLPLAKGWPNGQQTL
jgi:hypothetical protein